MSGSSTLSLNKIKLPHGHTASCCRHYFVLLLLSLLATTIMEFIAAGFSLRGKNLEKALKNLLASTDADEQVLSAFKKNSLYRQLSYRFGKKRYPPSYMSANSFQSILFDVILDGKDAGVGNLKERISQIQDEDLRNVLNQLMQESEEHLDTFKENVRGWYDNIMGRASGWYKKSTQKILVVVGLLIAVVFNADTIALYQHLESNPESVEKLVVLAESFVEENEGVSLQQQDREFAEAYDNLKGIINTEINQIQSYGIGWKNVNLLAMERSQWGIKILGWIVTALSISLGAPFWFDLLRKIVNIRSAGRSE